MLLTSVRLALRGLGRNKLRTALTMLGMVIGVAAVMTMVALGNGAQQNVEQDVRSAGTNLVHISAGNFTRGGEESNIATGLGSATTLTPADADALAREVPGIKRIAPASASAAGLCRGRAASMARCWAPPRRSRRCTTGGSTRAASSATQMSPAAGPWSSSAAPSAISCSALARKPSDGG